MLGIHDSLYTPKTNSMRQPRPGSKAISIWNHLISSFTKDDHPSLLKQPLGAWTRFHSNRGCWESYLDPQKSIIYYKTDTWHSYHKHGTQISVYQAIDNFQPLSHYIPITVHTFACWMILFDPTTHFIGASFRVQILRSTIMMCIVRYIISED